MNNWQRWIFVLCLPLLAQCQSATQPLAFNQIQFMGSHNSYKDAIEPTLMQVLRQSNPQAAIALDYAHVSLPAQLDLGLRKLELDVFYDPLGGRYATPAGLQMAPGQSVFDLQGEMTKPGFKVLHVQDLDFRSQCQRFEHCLAQIRNWSVAHPEHLPLVIIINAKDAVIDRPGFTLPLAFEDPAWQQLDDEIFAGLQNLLLTPADIQGSSASLRESVLSGWPQLDKMRGKVLLVLDDSAAKKQAYLASPAGAAGHAMFVDVQEDSPHAAIRIVNDPVAQFDYIQQLVRQGFVVRTRADADTLEARSGATGRLQAALASGAQIISTDYYMADQAYGHGYKAGLPGPGIARCNPLLALDNCEINH